MRDSEKTNALTMSWVPVVDARGRTHMEAHWVATTPSLIPAPAPQAAHAA